MGQRAPVPVDVRSGRVAGRTQGLQLVLHVPRDQVRGRIEPAGSHPGGSDLVRAGRDRRRRRTGSVGPRADAEPLRKSVPCRAALVRREASGRVARPGECEAGERSIRGHDGDPVRLLRDRDDPDATHQQPPRLQVPGAAVIRIIDGLLPEAVFLSRDLAQLVERHPYKVDVIGSSPVVPTKSYNLRTSDGQVVRILRPRSSFRFFGFFLPVFR